MTVLAVDLAARYSAACVLADDGQVVDQWDSWGRTETAFINLLTECWYASDFFIIPDVMVVEDLPHRLPFASLVKQVCRLQGRIVERMDSHGAADAVLFLPPAVWRKGFAGLERGTGPGAVVSVAADLGYTAPDLTARIGKAADKVIARKVATDYCAAFLIGTWARTTFAATGSYDAPATSRYATAYHKAVPA